MCPTASYDDLPDGGSADDASLAFAPINPMQHLKIAAISVRVDVIGNRRSAVCDRQLQSIDHRLVQSRGACRAQARSLRQGMNAG